MGSISFGLAFVAGKNRVPKPATGNTAFVTFNIVVPLWKSLFEARSSHLKHLNKTDKPKTLRLRLLVSRAWRFVSHRGKAHGALTLSGLAVGGDNGNREQDNHARYPMQVHHTAPFASLAWSPSYHEKTEQ
jgi:hypothetical protein